jgi:hypothetical protein
MVTLGDISLIEIYSLPSFITVVVEPIGADPISIWIGGGDPDKPDSISAGIRADF